MYLTKYIYYIYNIFVHQQEGYMSSLYETIVKIGFWAVIGWWWYPLLAIDRFFDAIFHHGETPEERQVRRQDENVEY